ncbi:MAG: hypothetical protein QMD94_04680, partial [Candidatus Omnitrophota bacterium]|nr:hypothetical protein [Candidatus Omnitrophota bacterium]
MHTKSKFKRITYSVICFILAFQQITFAQMAELNIAGHLAGMRKGMVIDKFRPLHLRYFSYDLNKDNFKFMFDKGDVQQLEDGKFKEQSNDLLKYFLIGISLPDSKFWVNLRPESEDQIIEPELAQTDLGKVLLEADLQLKKDTAKYTSPETPEGRQYWDKLYKKAGELFGQENAKISTLTRPWIVPGEIIVRETSESVFIYKSTLKVMLEDDYIKESKSPLAAVYSFNDPKEKALNEYSSQLIRELIIPKLTKEVNTSKRYAGLRQVFYSLILSRWFKARFGNSVSQLTGSPAHRLTGTPANQLTGVPTNSHIKLINSKNLTNLTSQTSWSKTTYFKEYQKSFSKGEYNLTEPVYTPTGQVIRNYFSGGIQAGSAIRLIGVAGLRKTVLSNLNLIGIKKDDAGVRAGLALEKGDANEQITNLPIKLNFDQIMMKKFWKIIESWRSDENWDLLLDSNSL